MSSSPEQDSQAVCVEASASSRPSWCALMVTFHPGPESVGNARRHVQEFGHLIVVDNGSAPSELDAIGALDGVELIRLGENRGIAAALNIGAERALARGCDWVCTFDQDSTPADGFAKAMQGTLEVFPRVSMIGSYIIDPAVGRPPLWLIPHPSGLGFRRAGSPGCDFAGITCVITSGTLTSLPVWRELGGFDESLFIDSVDTDYCLRSRRMGHDIAVSVSAILHHKLGRREERSLLGMHFFPMNHSPLRQYYIARNRVVVLRRHGLALGHWAVFELLVGIYWPLRMLCFEQQRWRKTKAIMLGLWDGFRSKLGAASAARITSIV